MRANCPPKSKKLIAFPPSVQFAVPIRSIRCMDKLDKSLLLDVRVVPEKIRVPYVGPEPPQLLLSLQLLDAPPPVQVLPARAAATAASQARTKLHQARRVVRRDFNRLSGSILHL